MFFLYVLHLVPILSPSPRFLVLFFGPSNSLNTLNSVSCSTVPAVVIYRAYKFKLSPISPIHSLLDSFVALARSYAFIHAPLDERSGMEYGFMYPVDTSDQSAMKKVQQRMGQANVEAQKLRPLIVGIVEKRKHEQKRKPWTRRIFERRRSQNMKIGNDGADQLKEQGRDGQTEMAVPT